MFKKFLSAFLSLVMLLTLACVGIPAVYAEETEEPGEWYTYYFLAPEKFFTTNDSIGLYYWTPSEVAAWPGIEIKAENCVHTFPDGCRVFEVKVWQLDADTTKEVLTTPTIVFNSWVDAAIDPVNGHQTANVNVEGYWENDVDSLAYGDNVEEFPRYESGTEILNFNGMIYVPNMALSSENEFSGAVQIGGGVWYYYWGDGNYGVTEKAPEGYEGNGVHDKAPEESDTDVTPPENAYCLGDVTGDGEVKMDDVVKVQKQIAKLLSFNEQETTAADVNNDKDIKMDDVVTMQKFIAKLIASF